MFQRWALVVTAFVGSGLLACGRTSTWWAPDGGTIDAAPALCGNARIEEGEECDDGNQADGDGCSSSCRLEICGNGILEPGEACDDGNRLSGDGCRADCASNEQCGNGILDPGENCDAHDANAETPDAPCRTDCRPRRCGDAVADSDEECDEGPANSDLIPGACRMSCQLPWCGDGVRDPDEGCDDGGVVGEDGCSSDCLVEYRWQCSGSPSVCSCTSYREGSDCTSCTVYVDVGVTGGQHDGESWATAFQTVQQGIDAAYAAGPGCEVWVAQGTYHIYNGIEKDTVKLRTGVAIYGGFSGHETEREERNPATQVTVLDGHEEGNTHNRVFHVVTAWYTTDATLDGFTITAGLANGHNLSFDDSGGGLFAYGAAITVTDCLFIGNSATHGGGISSTGGNGLRVQGCTFAGNSASGGGGGMSNTSSSPTVSGCIFAGNSAGGGGGMLNRVDSSPTVTNCTFSGNSADFGGGFGNSRNSSPTVTSCTFAGNSALLQGGGMRNVDNSSPELTNCIVWGNAAPSGPSFHDDGTGAPQVVYSSIQGGHAGMGNKSSGPGFASPPSNIGPWNTVAYDTALRQTALHDSFAGWTPGALVGLFAQPDDTDPRWFPIVANSADTIWVRGDVTDFVASGDNYLLHDLHLSSSSPCIDAGYGCSTPGGCTIPPLVPETPTTDLECNARYDAWQSAVNGGTGTPNYVDMGAYEYHP